MNENNIKLNAWRTASMLGIALTLYALVLAYGEYKSWAHPASQGATITVSGMGEATAIPDIATITFTIRETAKTVPEAQKLVEAKAKPALNAIEKLGVASKDVKTASYSVSPKYEYTTCAPSVPYCQQKQMLVGYDVVQTTQVKVRKVATAGEVIATIGENKISELNGPSFEVDDIDMIKKEAKEKAIKDARVKAQATAKSLGVSLGRIVGYSEDNGGYPTPMMYMKAESASFGGAADRLQSVSLPQGESVIKSNVSIIYELD